MNLKMNFNKKYFNDSIHFKVKWSSRGLEQAKENVLSVFSEICTRFIAKDTLPMF